MKPSSTTRQGRFLLIAVMYGTVFATLPGCGWFRETGGPIPEYDAPPGASFVKPGMTREGRLLDFAACGFSDGLRLNFSEEKIKEIKERGEFYVVNDKVIKDGFFVALRKGRECMKSKGYYELPLGACESDVGYPPQCMYP